MNGIDISHWQSGLNLANISADFVIMKATEGTYYVDDRTEEFFAAAQKSGKLCGLYHFASGTNGARREAQFFVDHIKDKLGKAILALDWEADAVKKGVAYAKEFLDEVYSLTGIRCAVYMSKGICRSYNWASVAVDYPLWVAQYANKNPVYGYQDNPWTDQKGYGAWEEPILFQYTSSGYLPGYGRRLDLDKCYLDAHEWETLATGKLIERPDVPLKSIEEVAEEVWAGKWGNGQERKDELAAAGYDFSAVQEEVNIIAAAKDVIAGKYGNGAARRVKLAAAGYDYDRVQKKVNEILGVRG